MLDALSVTVDALALEVVGGGAEERVRDPAIGATKGFFPASVAAEGGTNLFGLVFEVERAGLRPAVVGLADLCCPMAVVVVVVVVGVSFFNPFAMPAVALRLLEVLGVPWCIR